MKDTIHATINEEIDAKIKELVERYLIQQTVVTTQEKEDDVVEIRKEKERFDFKNFSNCKPPEFEGETNPMISIRWISEVEGTFLLCEVL